MPETITHEFWHIDQTTQDIAEDDAYWNEYVATRPVYDDPFLQRIYDYHAGHSSSFDTAIDIGAGPGDLAYSLTQKFNTVISSDNDAKSLHYVQRRFGNPRGLSYALCTAENVTDHFASSSLDLVTLAECFPLLDEHLVLKNFHTLLKPNGTLAIFFYGRPHFVEPEYAPKCQPIFDQIMDRNFKPIVSGGNEVRRKAWKKAAMGMHSWLDYVPFNPDEWYDVRRHKWNPHTFFSFFSRHATDFDVETKSSITDDERVSEERDPSFWLKEWDLDWVKRFVKASFPKPRELDKPDPGMDKLFEELGAAMGGQSAVRKFSWPVVLILATKRAETPE